MLGAGFNGKIHSFSKWERVLLLPPPPGSLMKLDFIKAQKTEKSL